MSLDKIGSIAGAGTCGENESHSSLLAAFPLGRHSFNVFLLNFIFVALGLPMGISVCQRSGDIGWPISS